MYTTKLSKWQCVRNKAKSIFSCEPDYGWLYKAYDFIAGELYCMCCVFWRGFICGLVFVAAIGGSILTAALK